MAKKYHLSLLGRGEHEWNEWRLAHPKTRPDFSKAQLQGRQLSHFDLSNADLRQAAFQGAELRYTKLRLADLRGAKINDARAPFADFRQAKLQKAFLWGSDFRESDFRRANLRGANLRCAQLVRADFRKAVLTGCKVYGTSAWEVKLEGSKQDKLIITAPNEPGTTVTVDNLHVAQFVYLLLDNRNIRDVIDTVGEKGVLILGRFKGRRSGLERLRTRFRQLGFVPVVFDFEKPASRDFTETVRTLASLSSFIVADITAPNSVPHEAQAIIPDYMVPFVPIIQKGEREWPMLQDLWRQHRWVFKPLTYPSIDELLPKVGSAIVQPALEMRKELVARRSEVMGTRALENFLLDQE